ncbi:MAG: aldehyde dehydrogenase (NADP(+)) [Phycisphaerales bacterium JB059]
MATQTGGAFSTKSKALEIIEGRSLVGGKSAGPAPKVDLFFAEDPCSGKAIGIEYHPATDEEIDRAASDAWSAFGTFGPSSGEARATLLERIAGNIADLGPSLLEIAGKETGLSVTRLRAERERTTSTMLLFAHIIRQGDWVRATIDRGAPARRPAPKPDLRSMLRPLGPVAVFGASNFPLAYSTAGGDTASALAAACPVVVKGHPLHPGTGEMVARAVVDAVAECSMDPGVFAFLHAGGKREKEIGARLVRHQAIRAVGFTGSVGGGMALARMASERDDPIPVFAEMGSTNPVFICPSAMEKDAERIAERIAGSMTNAVGQMCTCPGLIFVSESEAADRFAKALMNQLGDRMPETMLARRIADNYTKRLHQTNKVEGVRLLGGSVPAASERSALRKAEGAPALFMTDLKTFLHHPTLQVETFGPSAIVVLCNGEQGLMDGAAAILGSLTASIWGDEYDGRLLTRLSETMAHRVGRIVFNGVPTGVEVCTSMVHGGPYPASNQPHTTAVGPRAIERWRRAVCYQNAPKDQLPPELQDENPLMIRRLVDGVPSEGPL